MKIDGDPREFWMVEIGRSEHKIVTGGTPMTKQKPPYVGCSLILMVIYIVITNCKLDVISW